LSIIQIATDVEDFAMRVEDISKVLNTKSDILGTLEIEEAFRDLNNAREIVGKSLFLSEKTKNNRRITKKTTRV
jgi:acetate kinase